MLSAYVLVESEVGKVAHVAQAITDLDGVELAEDLAGPYDVIPRVEASGLDELGRLIVFRIQVVDGVTRTLTCMVLHRSPHPTPHRSSPGAGITVNAAQFGSDTPLVLQPEIVILLG
jgi:DNA-binding Lrp family transcriptional regulator